jgi:two-component system, chemotaxis family, sensor kinase CheA
MNQQEFLQRLREAFAIEAEEHWTSISNALAVLPHASDVEARPLIETVFRDTHSLKGASRAIGRRDIETLCQAMESVFAVWKHDVHQRRPAQFNVLVEAVSRLATLLDASVEQPSLSLTQLVDALATEARGAASSGAAHAGSDVPPLQPVTVGQDSDGDAPKREDAHRDSDRGNAPGHLPQAEEHQPSITQVNSGPKIPGPYGTNGNGKCTARDDASVHARRTAEPEGVRATRRQVRVSLDELDALYRTVEELQMLRHSIERWAADMTDALQVTEDVRKQLRDIVRSEALSLEGVRSVARHPHGHDDAFAPDVAPSAVKNRAHGDGPDLQQLGERLESLTAFMRRRASEAQGSAYTADVCISGLTEQVKQMLLLPFSHATVRIPGTVMQLARELGKEVRCVVEGEDVRIDKRILEGLSDPFTHMLRNAIDHGIETPEARRRAGKPPFGTITVSIAEREAGRVDITISDDGAGIDPAAVRAAAAQGGTLAVDKLAALDDDAALQLIFESGLSTLSEVGVVSGRGVGMAVVRDNISALGGTVRAEGAPGKGTSIRFSLPISLSDARGVFVRCGAQTCILPLPAVRRCAMVHPSDLFELDGQFYCDADDRIIPVARLDTLLQFTARPSSTPDAHVQLLVIGAGERLVGLIVDEVLYEQDVVVKPLPPPVEHIPCIGGASLQSTGELLPVLHVPDLLEAIGAAPTARRVTEDVTVRTVPRILVVDDSITSRVLLSDILLASGCQVDTAVDGLDGLTRLRAGGYDLLVSDVEMPRMNGFELTEAVRGDERLAHLPVVLVTGLERREDRERGFDAGANAYIVKSSFDQSDLLETVRRFV